MFACFLYKIVHVACGWHDWNRCHMQQSLLSPPCTATLSRCCIWHPLPRRSSFRASGMTRVCVCSNFSYPGKLFTFLPYKIVFEMFSAYHVEATIFYKRYMYICMWETTQCARYTHTHTIHNCFSSSNIGHNNQQHTIATPNKYAAWPEHEWFITLRERIFKWHHLCWLCGIFGNASQYQEDRSEWCECICWILALGAIFISIAIRCTVVYDSRQWTAKNYMYI